ncbi:hypothetical protein MTO96_013181 [Rhipicephalus appendiculatus]
MEWDPLMHALAFRLMKTTELENFHIRTPHEFGNKRDMSKVARRNLLRESHGSRGTREAKVPLHQHQDQLVIELLVKECRIDLGVPAFDGSKNIDTRRDLKFRECAFAVDPEEDQRNPM